MNQFQIHFPLFPEGLFGKVKKQYGKQEEDKKEQEIKHLKRVAAGFKGWRTRRTGK
ncbi:MAG: hypothetical protein JNK73_13070 [Bacteroidia bacterium]|nr:hypothetical protein [Bacteroidia bacterium]